MKFLAGVFVILAGLGTALGTGTTVSPIPGGDCNYQCPVVGVAPVCGTDGRTYSSACFLECFSKKQVQSGHVSVSVSVRSPGRCPEQPCICPAVVDPVCGKNGWTYPNICQMECDNAKHQRYGYPPIYLRGSGKCPKTGCVCDEREQLVCGTDGRTYGNPCKLNCESKRQQELGRPPIFIAKNGRCPPPPCNCPPFVYPVCGTNDKSYRNTCFLECASIENQNSNRPPINLYAYNVCRDDKCHCSADVKPVCASNGNTYNNTCALQCVNGRRFALGQAPLVKLYNGSCKGCVCPANWDPVCGSDEKTYGNLCKLNCENQSRSYQDLPPLKYTKGECGCNCLYVWKPVCASDFHTYPNECALGCENRRRVNNGFPALHVTQYGECGCNCDNFKLPVCGSDNRTYWNVCWLNCNNFYLIRNGKPAISIDKNGPC